MVEDDVEFLQLSNLFNSLGIIEKGIEKIYHHLLEEKRIENLKEVCDKYGLSLKRGYKICSVLSDLELVQIYDRPMKINLATPVLPIWQKVINKRIESLKSEYKEEQIKCSNALEDFSNSYKLKETDIVQEPVELIIFDVENITEIYYPFFAKMNCKIATGIRYENPFISYIKQNSVEKIKNHIGEAIKNALDMVKYNLEKISIQVIFNSELLQGLLTSTEYLIVSNQLEKTDLTFKSLKVHITDENFSNFSLTDEELIQPSFDPTNKLMGCYISRNKNIYHIFENKFTEIFKKGIPIQEYISDKKNKIEIDSMTDKQIFSLCLL